jgi:excisionase family DNA binding protein
MATPHFFFTTYCSGLGVSRPPSGRGRRDSAGLAHLARMEPITTAQGTAAPAAESGDGVVIGGVFEPALSLKELAEQLHVSVQTLYDLRSQGRGPTGFRVGRHLRFRQSEIEAWLLRLEEEDHDRHPESGRR